LSTGGRIICETLSTEAPGPILMHPRISRVSAMQFSRSFSVLFVKKEPAKNHVFFERKKQKTFDD
jgi:hypothetical protein